MRHVGRIKDTLVDQMDQNEIILINSPHNLSKKEVKKLFPFARLPEELGWYNANLDNRELRAT